MVDEIVWAAEKLADDRALADGLVAAAGRYIDAHSWAATAAATHALYAGLIAGEAPAASGIGRSRIVTRTDSDRIDQRPTAPRHTRGAASGRRVAG
jgi:hypothetical protein